MSRLNCLKRLTPSKSFKTIKSSLGKKRKLSRRLTSVLLRKGTKRWTISRGKSKGISMLILIVLTLGRSRSSCLKWLSIFGSRNSFGMSKEIPWLCSELWFLFRRRSASTSFRIRAPSGNKLIRRLKSFRLSLKVISRRVKRKTTWMTFSCPSMRILRSRLMRMKCSLISWISILGWIWARMKEESFGWSLLVIIRGGKEMVKRIRLKNSPKRLGRIKVIRSSKRWGFWTMRWKKICRSF